MLLGSPGVPRPAPVPLGLQPQQGQVVAVRTLGLELLMDPVLLNLQCANTVYCSDNGLNDQEH